MGWGGSVSRVGVSGCSNSKGGNLKGYSMHTLSTAVLGPEEGLAGLMGLKHWGTCHGCAHGNNIHPLRTSSDLPNLLLLLLLLLVVVVVAVVFAGAHMPWHAC